MPKKIEGYECEQCNARFSNVFEAKGCEDRHPAIDALKIAEVMYAPGGQNEAEKNMNQTVPRQLKIELIAYTAHYGLINLVPRNNPA